MAAAVATNRLIDEKSPYLLQHAHNPVDWYPWGEEAFKKAKELNRLIFLSVGYSTCHWCHVMEHESFESDEVARVLNENFVSIKVDREERPDVDKLYMTFIQVTNGGGGWPMSVFLTPNLHPVFGGTYFPPNDAYGRIGFISLLKLLAEKWQKDGNLIKKQGGIYSELLKAASKIKTRSLPDAEEVLDECFDHYSNSFDEINKGFGTAPKFPHPVDLDFLLHFYAVKKNEVEGGFALNAVGDTLQALLHGGIHDHVGKGFHRYSVDACWHVPHFEKMLYDQGQLMSVFSNYFLLTGKFKEGIEDIADYVQNSLTHESGGFYSAEDADSLPSKDALKKREGAFCVWTEKEIDETLKGIKSIDFAGIDVAKVFKEYYYVKSNGNVPDSADQHGELKNQNVLIMKKSKKEIARKFNITEETLAALIESCKAALLEIRKERPKPHLDSKILTSWNGLMISGFARASVALEREDLAERAKKAVCFIREHLYNKDEAKLLRCAYVDNQGNVTYKKESSRAFADDYSFLIQALLDLYDCCFDESFLIFARDLQDALDKHFWNFDQNNGYYQSEKDPSILVRLMEDQDGAEPMANSVAALNLLRLADIFDKADFREKAKKILEGAAERMKKVPYALPKMVVALLRYNQPAAQIVICGSLKNGLVQDMVKEINSHFIPNKCIIVVDASNEFLLGENKHLATLTAFTDKPAVFLCKNMACDIPITELDRLKQVLRSFY